MVAVGVLVAEWVLASGRVWVGVCVCVCVCVCVYVCVFVCAGA